MRDIKEFVAGVSAKIADIAARTETIKQETTVIALDVMTFSKEIETALPQSDARDGLIAVLVNLKAALIELGALPPMVTPASEGADGGIE
jgi:hypothetical protein